MPGRFHWNTDFYHEIDLLVDKRYYSNRSDFTNQSVRQALNDKKSVIEEMSKQQNDLDFRWFIGVMSLEKEELLKASLLEAKLYISTGLRSILRYGEKPCLMGSGFLHIWVFLE